MARVRPVSTITYEDWMTGNPLFQTYVDVFDRVFKNINYVPEKYYVKHPRENGTHEEFISRALFSDHDTGEERVYILTAPVGRGKTEFCNHLGKIELPRAYDDFIFVKIDCFDNLTGSVGEVERLEKDIKEIIENVLLDNSTFDFNKSSDLGKAIYSYTTRGDKTTNRQAVHYLNDVSLQSFISFVLSPRVSEAGVRLLIVFDNIDECSSDGMETVMSIAKRISGYSANKHGKACTLIPMRDYTVKATTTTHYPNSALPKLDVLEMAYKRIEMLENKLSQQVKIEKEKIDNAVKLDVVSTRRKGYDFEGMSGVIKAENALQIAKFLLLKLRGGPRRERNYIDDYTEVISLLSGDNYKTVIYNLYYMLHSCKLNLQDLVKYVFSEDDRKGYEKKFLKTKLSGPLIYDLLMGIHTPFYDFKVSLIPNFFNNGHSSSDGNYRDTLVSVRMLGYFFNRQEASFEEVCTFFYRMGYDKRKHIHPSLELLLNHGLLYPENGIEVKHLSPESVLTITKSGKYYFDKVISNLRYLDYIFDDTYIDEELIIPIGERYKKGHARITKMRLHDQFRGNCLKFLAREEEAEFSYLKSHNIDVDAYMRTCYHRSHGQPQKLTRIILKSWEEFEGFLLT